MASNLRAMATLIAKAFMMVCSFLNVRELRVIYRHHFHANWRLVDIKSRGSMWIDCYVFSCQYLLSLIVNHMFCRVLRFDKVEAVPWPAYRSIV